MQPNFNVIAFSGKCYFRGPWFVTPPEIPPIPGRMFYKQEVFLSTVEDTNPLVSIIGKCAVLDYNDYISCKCAILCVIFVKCCSLGRPTEIPESDVYICTSVYDEINRQVKKLLPDGLKRYAHSSAVTEDEIYYFFKLINVLKVRIFFCVTLKIAHSWIFKKLSVYNFCSNWQ